MLSRNRTKSSPTLYNHFILLHTAISILINEKRIKKIENIDYCAKLLKEFVLGLEELYGKQYVLQNVHNLLHLCDDVKKYGALHNFSAFRFENYMTTIKNMIRKGDKPLQQIERRYSERETLEKNLIVIKENSLQMQHNNGPLGNCRNVSDHYKKLVHTAFTINCSNLKVSCVLLRNGTFAMVKNIVSSSNACHKLIIQSVQTIHNLYDLPDSRFVSIGIGKVLNRAEIKNNNESFFYYY